MNKYLLIFALLFYSITLFSQDIILCTNNEIVECKITKVDSVAVYFKTDINDESVQKLLPLSKIRSYDWNNKIISVETQAISNQNDTIERNTKSNQDFVIRDFTNNSETINNYKGNYLYFSSENILKADAIELKYPFLGSPYFLVDEKIFDAANVKFYQNEEGFFSNIMDITGSYSPNFSQREIKGKINLYSKTTESSNFAMGTPIGFTGYAGTGGYGGGMYMTASLPYTHYYYNKDFDVLKKVNYNNLKIDLADNPKSILFLEEYRKAIKTGRLLAIGGYSIVGVAMISLISKMDSDPNNNNPEPTNETPAYVAPHVAAIVGGMTLILTKKFYFDDIKKPEAVKKAIDAYNN